MAFSRRNPNLWLFFIPFFMLITNGVQSQSSSVFHFNLEGSGSEQDPLIFAKPGGGYFLTYRLTKSNPDSAYCGLSYLDNSFQPIWNKVFKTHANTVISGLVAESSGLSFLLNGYNTQSKYFSAWLELDNAGSELQKMQLADSSILNSGSLIQRQVKLANGSRMLTSSVNSKIFRLNAAGNIDYARSFYLAGSPNRSIQITKLLAVPQSNTWYAIGQIANTSLGCLLQFQDTTLVNNRIYAGNAGFTGFLRDGAVLPNGDLQLLGTEGITLRRVNPAGIPVWTKFHKVVGSYPQAQHLGSDGSIWVTGSLTAGQAGGLVAKFTSDGNYISHIGQFQLGFSHSPIRSMVPIPQNQMLAVQKGYYNNTNVILGNQITTGADFVCFNYQAGTISDTSYVVTDSSSTKIRWNLERFGKSATLNFPLQVLNQSLVKGPVTCSQVSVDDELSTITLNIFPNPATDWLVIEGLSKLEKINIYNMTGSLIFSTASDRKIRFPKLVNGLYLLEIPELQYRVKVVLEN